MVSGHTHQAYNCVLSAQKELIGRYRTLLGPLAAEEVGETSAPITRIGVPSGETPLGNLIADAQLSATDDEQGAVAAFMNLGGVRADLDAGPVTYEEAFTVQPFGNYLTTLDLTGAKLDCLLEQQFVTERMLQPSATVHYTVRQAGTPGTAADPCAGTKVDEIVLGDVPVDPAATYRITVRLRSRGDGASTLPAAATRVSTAVRTWTLAQPRLGNSTRVRTIRRRRDRRRSIPGHVRVAANVLQRRTAASG